MNTPWQQCVAPLLEARDPADLKARMDTALRSPSFADAMRTVGDRVQSGRGPVCIELPPDGGAGLFGHEHAQMIRVTMIKAARVAAAGAEVCRRIGTTKALKELQSGPVETLQPVTESPFNPLVGALAAGALAQVARSRITLEPWLIQTLVGLWRESIDVMAQCFEIELNTN